MRQTTDTIATVNRCLEVLIHLPPYPVVIRVIEALKSGSYEKIYNGDIPMPEFNSYEQFACEYFAYNLLRKYPFKGVDRAGVALKTFAAAEEICSSTNRRLSLGFRNGIPARDAIFALREKISSVLGRFPGWENLEHDFAFGPGATTRLKSKCGDVYYKLRGNPEVTRNTLPLAQTAIMRVPLWFSGIAPKTISDLCVVVAGSKVTTVPKDAKTDRTIAIEPCMNMYVQKALGTAIRRRLRRVGVDLNDQTRNQVLARQGSLNGDLATVDLSMASDTVAKELVELLLPDDWLSALKQCRSHRYVLNSEVKTFAKFSTMGNGYTFELESLLFWAITSYCVDLSFVADRTIAIYGDDIICHEYVIDWLYPWLEYFGFTPNVHKSFRDGPFRESCGKHYFTGSDVTPVFVKDEVISASRSAWFCNSITRWVHRCRRLDGSSFLPKQVFEKLSLAVPPPFDRHIPDDVGDGGIVVPADALTGEPLLAVKRPNHQKYSEEYQSGFDYLHAVTLNTWDRMRDPEDVPYLLRHLYNLERDGQVEKEPWNHDDQGPPSPVGVSHETRVVRSWIRSWTMPNW